MPKSRPVDHPGWVIRDWLRANHVRQQELAAQLGISEKHLSGIVRGHALWSPHLAVKIEEATGISAVALVTLKAEYVIDRRRRNLPAATGGRLP